jgi:hypothetical protein
MLDREFSGQCVGVAQAVFLFQCASPGCSFLAHCDNRDRHPLKAGLGFKGTSFP